MYICLYVCMFVCLLVCVYVCIVHAVGFLKHSWHLNTTQILWERGKDKILSKLECFVWFLVSKWRQEDMPQCALYIQLPFRHQKNTEQSSYLLYNFTLENSRSSCHLNFISLENTATCTQPAGKSVVVCEESIINCHDILTWTVKGVNWRKYKTVTHKQNIL